MTFVMVSAVASRSLCGHGFKHVKPVPQFCSKFDLMFAQFVGINFLGQHNQFSSLEPCVDLGSPLNHSMVTACVYAVEH